MVDNANTLPSEQRLDLLPLHNPSAGEPLNYTCSLDDCVRLAGAHGEEIVRDVFIDPQVRQPPHPPPLQKKITNPPELEPRVLTALQSSTIFTCGEDGKVRSWQAEGFGGQQQQQAITTTANASDSAEEKHSKKEKKHKDKHKKKDKKKGKERFEPY